MPNDNPLVTIHARISGRVQGVGYRYWTAREARTRHIYGWVRNRDDGTVEALFHGYKEAVDDLLSACYKGPVFASVTNIHTKAGEYHGPEIFEEHPTC